MSAPNQKAILQALAVCCELTELRTRLRRVVSDGHGPATKNTLRGIAKAHGYRAEDFELILKLMLDLGDLVMFGDRKGATYGVPRRRRAA